MNESLERLILRALFKRVARIDKDGTLIVGRARNLMECDGDDIPKDTPGLRSAITKALEAAK